MQLPNNSTKQFQELALHTASVRIIGVPGESMLPILSFSDFDLELRSLCNRLI